MVLIDNWEVDDSVSLIAFLDENHIVEKAQKSFRSHFHENLGQIKNEHILHYGTIPGGRIGFKEDGLALERSDSKNAIAISFEGARSVTPHGLDEVGLRTSYFLGDRGNYAGTRGYTTIAYDDLWPGINLLYRVTTDGAKYEF